MATARRIELTAEEEQTLRMWTRAGTTEQRLARRRGYPLLRARAPDREVGERCGLSQISVFKWKRRFLEMRLDGLADAPRRGRPARISAAQRLAAIDLATSTPRKGKTSWSVRDLAQASGLSATTVHRILSGASSGPTRSSTGAGAAPTPSSRPSRRPSSASTSTPRRTPWSSASMRRARSRRSTAPSPSCRCGPAIRGA